MKVRFKKLSKRKLKEFEAEALRRGLTLSQAMEEAIDLWLSRRAAWTEADANNAAYEREKQRLLREHAGKYAVFAFGRLIGVYNTLEEVIETLRGLQEKPCHAIVTKIGEDVPRVLEWWGGSINP